MVHAHPEPDSYTSQLMEAAVTGLEVGGHGVDTLDLYAMGFAAAMTCEERRSYEDDQRELDPQLLRHGELVLDADALIFVFPTWWYGPPAILKGWLERVLVPQIAFRLDDRTNKVRSELRHIRRLVGITTHDASRLHMLMRGNTARWTITRTLRLMASPLARSTWLDLDKASARSPGERNQFIDRVTKKMAGL